MFTNLYRAKLDSMGYIFIAQCKCLACWAAKVDRSC